MSIDMRGEGGAKLSCCPFHCLIYLENEEEEEEEAFRGTKREFKRPENGFSGCLLKQVR